MIPGNVASVILPVTGITYVFRIIWLGDDDY
jgi:hypothetical protein